MEYKIWILQRTKNWMKLPKIFTNSYSNFNGLYLLALESTRKMDAIIIYVNSEKAVKNVQSFQYLQSGWMNFPVIVKKMGNPKPLITITVDAMDFPVLQDVKSIDSNPYLELPNNLTVTTVTTKPYSLERLVIRTISILSILCVLVFFSYRLFAFKELVISIPLLVTFVAGFIGIMIANNDGIVGDSK